MFRTSIEINGCLYEQVFFRGFKFLHSNFFGRLSSTLGEFEARGKFSIFRKEGNVTPDNNLRLLSQHKVFDQMFSSRVVKPAE
jgi:hypothetical protein